MNTEPQTDRITQLEAALDKAQKEREQFKHALYMHVEFPSHGEAWEKASQFQKRIKELESELASMREGVQHIYDNPAYAQPWAEGLLKTSSGKTLLDRLQAVEKECSAQKLHIEHLESCLTNLDQHRQAVEKENQLLKEKYESK